MPVSDPVAPLRGLAAGLRSRASPPVLLALAGWTRYALLDAELFVAAWNAPLANSPGLPALRDLLTCCDLENVVFVLGEHDRLGWIAAARSADELATMLAELQGTQPPASTERPYPPWDELAPMQRKLLQLLWDVERGSPTAPLRAGDVLRGLYGEKRQLSRKRDRRAFDRLVKRTQVALRALHQRWCLVRPRRGRLVIIWPDG